MSEIDLVVDGQKIVAQMGDTILEACQEAGIEIPTLCHYSNISDVGACRICTVEIEGKGFDAACTTPAQDGLKVKTDTEELWGHRRNVLELICAEENHFCMYCDKDGDCELQDLFKEYGVDHLHIPFSYNSYPVDSISEHLVLDHNRCIKCGRCVRICSEVVANDTLDFGSRGSETKVIADLNQPLGESTCISCGACMQVCPTGTILGKHSLYRGNTTECGSVNSTCAECSLNCETEVFSRADNLVQIYGREIDLPSGGQLCARGRFLPLSDDRERVIAPMIGGERVSEEQAWKKVGEILTDFSSVEGYTSGRLPNETLEVFQKMMEKVDGVFDVTGGDKVRAENEVMENLNLDDPIFLDSKDKVLSSGCSVVFDSSVVQSHPVLASYLRRNSKQGKKLWVVDEEEDLLARHSNGSVVTGGAYGDLVESFIELAERRRSPEDELSHEELALSEKTARAIIRTLMDEDLGLVVVGEKVRDCPTLEKIFELAEITDSKVISVSPLVNQIGKDLNTSSVRGDVEVGIVFASDDKPSIAMTKFARNCDYLIVLGARESVLTEEADVVLPVLAWHERRGRIKDIDGNLNRVNRISSPRLGIDSDVDILRKLTNTISKAR